MSRKLLEIAYSRLPFLGFYFEKFVLQNICGSANLLLAVYVVLNIIVTLSQGAIYEKG
jgi:hypothetical protein